MKQEYVILEFANAITMISQSDWKVGPSSLDNYLLRVLYNNSFNNRHLLLIRTAPQ